jgi:hypothetical protein
MEILEIAGSNENPCVQAYFIYPRGTRGNFIYMPPRQRDGDALLTIRRTNLDIIFARITHGS